VATYVLPFPISVTCTNPRNDGSKTVQTTESYARTEQSHRVAPPSQTTTPPPAPRTPHPAPRTPHPAPRTPHPAPRTPHPALSAISESEVPIIKVTHEGPRGSDYQGLRALGWGGRGEWVCCCAGGAEEAESGGGGVAEKDADGESGGEVGVMGGAGGKGKGVDETMSFSTKGLCGWWLDNLFTVVLYEVSHILALVLHFLIFMPS
jgi:hypothetical protein